MKRKCVPCGTALLITILMLAPLVLGACIREVIYTTDDTYTPFPEAEILGASFYYQRDGKDVTGDEAGMISKNEDGTYHVKMKRRSPSTSPSAMFITGSFEFSEFYKMTCTFPEDPSVREKPYRVYSCASRGMDGNIDADYPTATDLLGEAVFRNGVAIGTFDMTNEGINYLNPDTWGRPYITVFLYLYFQNVGDPDEYYEFTLDFAGGANGITPESPVTRAEIYRDGDRENKFVLEPSRRSVTDPVTGEPVMKTLPILARYNHRFDSLKLDSVPTVNTSSLHLDLFVPDADAGKEIEFEIRNVGLYDMTEFPAPADSNLVTREMIRGAKVLGGTETITERAVTPASTPPTYYYRIKTTIVHYEDMTGVKLVIPGTPETFNGTQRFTFTLNVPEKYSE